MKNSILIGNDINNLSNDKSWRELVKEIIEIAESDVKNIDDKPFPLLYEEIFMNSKSYRHSENDLKKKIGEIVAQIQSNEIHEEILSLDCHNYLTTNYEYVLQKCIDKSMGDKDVKNDGIIKEKRYSLFRHSNINGKNIWHVHGEINAPRTINLGFEHYGGQLQRLRNYVVNGAAYKKNRNYRVPLHNRIKHDKVDFNSWVDLVYLTDIHIVGLKLGYEETDLWWLFTDRARFFLKNDHTLKKNNIFYYCPRKYINKSKKELMEAIGIETIDINKEGKEFYQEVIKRIKSVM